MSPQNFAAVAEQPDEWVQTRDLSGACLLTQAGESVFDHPFGYADRSTGTPVMSSTRFGLASLTKMFTAVAVSDLVASGLLQFDARVVDVLPPSEGPPRCCPR